MIVIGLGGNVGGEEVLRERFVRAREALAELGAVKSAALYRTAPIGPEQPDYLNSAVGVRIADVQPGELISTILELERLLGRDRRGEVRWGPRPIDLDVLVWNGRVIRTPELDVPHPRLAQRRFALQPLCDLLGEEHVLPGQTVPLRTLLERVASQRLDLVSSAW